MIENYENILRSGKVIYNNEEHEIEDLIWNPHASFPGVSIKHLIKGDATGGRLSCHLVRVEPGCSLSDHTHEGKMELHEVFSGSGTAVVAGRKIIYRPGTVTIIPDNALHRVDAGESGITILAKFCPALL